MRTIKKLRKQRGRIDQGRWLGMSEYRVQWRVLAGAVLRFRNGVLVVAGVSPCFPKPSQVEDAPECS